MRPSSGWDAQRTKSDFESAFFWSGWSEARQATLRLGKQLSGQFEIGIAYRSCGQVCCTIRAARGIDSPPAFCCRRCLRMFASIAGRLLQR
jgi:hypothetical protein